ncbi:MAG: hypothetical protein IKJ35_05050 [Clostridia bacterium]|nr:hypothetical protein [Clostridia bacterium]
MIAIPQNQTPSPLVLVEERVARQGLRMTYRLLLCEPFQDGIYAISVFSDEDIRTAETGTDLLRATDFYRAVRDGFVTPCTLCDVLADLKASGV